MNTYLYIDSLSYPDCFTRHQRGGRFHPAAEDRSKLHFRRHVTPSHDHCSAPPFIEFGKLIVLS